MSLRRWPYVPVPIPGRLYRLRYWWWFTSWKPDEALRMFELMIDDGWSDYEARADAWPPLGVTEALDG